MVKGTPSYIKSNYGIGYELTIKELKSEQESQKMSEKIKEIFISPKLDCSSLNSSYTITLTIPIQEIEKTKHLIKYLEDNKIFFSIRSNSLEEAFIKMGEMEFKTSASELKDLEIALQNLTTQVKSKKSSFLKKFFILVKRRFQLLLKIPIQIIIILIMIIFPVFIITFTLDKLASEFEDIELIYGEVASLVFLITVVFLCSAFVYLPCYEKGNKLRFLLKRMGVGSYLYYFSMFFGDFLIGLFMCFVSFGLVFLLVNEEGNIFWGVFAKALLWLMTYIVQSKDTPASLISFNRLHSQLLLQVD